VALSVTEFRSSDDVDLLLSVGLKRSVTNVSGPDFKGIEFSDKSEKSDTTKGNNMGAYRIDRCFRELASGDETSFVSSIVFDCIDHMHSDLLVVGAWVTTESKVFECRKLINHKDLCVFCIGKFRITIAMINRHGLFMITRHFETVHVDRFGTERMEFGLFGMAKNTFLGLRKLLESRQCPTFGVKEVILAGVNGNSDRITVVNVG